jgi:hypothetical protein
VAVTADVCHTCQLHVLLHLLSQHRTSKSTSSKSSSCSSYNGLQQQIA